MEKIWEIAPKMPSTFKKKFPDIHPVILQLLYNRGLKTKKEINQFLSPDYSKDLHDPFILQDMKKVIDRIYTAIDKKEKIIICSDSDADGATSSTILFNILKRLGADNVQVRISDREKEGYGLNNVVVNECISNSIDLIITCDCGISDIDGISEAEKAGIPVIIIDHHKEPEKLPPALAIINPQLSREKYPSKNLAATGVVFKLVQAFLSDKRCKIHNKEAYEKWLLDLVAVGTVVDRMELIGENRTLVTYGLIVLNKTANQGLRSLIKQTGGLELGSLNARSISHYLGPRLNVSGKIDHASDASRLLLSQDRLETDKMSQRFDFLNSKRRQLVDKILQKLQAEIDKKPKENILVVLGENWSDGVLGIISARLADCYNRPSIVLNHRDGNVKGSGRSIQEFDLFNALSQLKKYFLNFGGHTRAIGFTLKNIDDFNGFKKAVLEIGKKKLKPGIAAPKIFIDSQLGLQDVKWDFYEELAKFEPFGQGNRQPNFVLKNVSLKSIQPVGKNSQHYRLLVGLNRKLIYFSADPVIKDVKVGDKIDVVIQLGVNYWNGQQELQMKVIDLKKPG